jgi:hypothetical protein
MKKLYLMMVLATSMITMGASSNGCGIRGVKSVSAAAVNPCPVSSAPAAIISSGSPPVAVIASGSSPVASVASGSSPASSICP